MKLVSRQARRPDADDRAHNGIERRPFELVPLK